MHLTFGFGIGDFYGAFCVLFLLGIGAFCVFFLLWNWGYLSFLFIGELGMCLLFVGEMKNFVYLNLEI
jgi:hypothetical protein